MRVCLVFTIRPVFNRCPPRWTVRISPNRLESSPFVAFTIGASREDDENILKHLYEAKPLPVIEAIFERLREPGRPSSIDFRPSPL